MFVTIYVSVVLQLSTETFFPIFRTPQDVQSDPFKPNTLTVIRSNLSNKEKRRQKMSVKFDSAEKNFSSYGF